MLLLQLTGLSGAGKSTLSQIAKTKLLQEGIRVEVFDGDSLRKTVNKDLGFSSNDRKENIRRLGFLANAVSLEYNVVIIAAINPFEEIRKELEEKYAAKVVWIYCPI